MQENESAQLGALDSRLTELEIRLALQDELIETLNEIVAAQQQQLLRLQQRHDEVQQHVMLLELGPRGLPGQEVPPHY